MVFNSARSAVSLNTYKTPSMARIAQLAAGIHSNTVDVSVPYGGLFLLSHLPRIPSGMLPGNMIRTHNSRIRTHSLTNSAFASLPDSVRTQDNLSWSALNTFKKKRKRKRTPVVLSLSLDDAPTPLPPREPRKSCSDRRRQVCLRSSQDAAEAEAEAAGVAAGACLGEAPTLALANAIA